MLNEMMNFVSELIKVKSQTKFLVITPDSEDIVMAAAKKYGVDSQKVIVDFALRSQMPLYISIMDVSIFFIRPVFSKKASSPKKMGEVLSLGIPIITNTGVGDVHAIVKNGKFGLLIEDFSAKSYQQVISQLDNLLKTDPALCSDAAKSYFSLEKGVNEYAKIYGLLSSK
jgi:glycosyltransferase involved in cell wall biosynthesis